MNFTPKFNVESVVIGILTIAAVGLIGWASHVAPTSGPIMAPQGDLAVQEFFQTRDPLPIVPAVERVPAPGLQTARSEYYQPVSWYKSSIGGKGMPPSSVGPAAAP